MILILYEIFYYCEIISFNYIREYISEEEASKKTIQRYIRFLEDAGLIQAKYSKAQRAYIPIGNGENHLPKLPDEKPKRLYMEKIIRLCTLMTDVAMKALENPVAWYRERYPNLSDRTRLRDFRQLREIGYVIEYLPADEDGPAGYYYSYPGRF